MRAFRVPTFSTQAAEEHSRITPYLLYTIPVLIYLRYLLPCLKCLAVCYRTFAIFSLAIQWKSYQGVVFFRDFRVCFICYVYFHRI